MLDADEQVQIAASSLVKVVGAATHTSLPTSCSDIHIAAKNVLDGTMKVGKLEVQQFLQIIWL